MFKSWKEVQAVTDVPIKNEINLGLDRLEMFLANLGNPQDKLKAIHIGGTNGKGSTLRLLESVLREEEMNVGVFHSPAYQYINDQISVNGVMISDEEMMEMIKVFYAHGLEEAELTEFELHTAMAFYYFAEIKKVDFALVEVGLGGREDSTNILLPILSIITNIGYDHLGFLGDTLEKIAYHKAGIIKVSIPVISGVIQDEAKKVIEQEAQEKYAKCMFINDDFTYYLDDVQQEEFSFRSQDIDIPHIRIPFQGSHQVANASLAIMAYLTLAEMGYVKRKDKNLLSAFRKARHPGRLEIVNENPLIVLDGAHNAEAVDALVTFIKRKFSEKNVYIVFSALVDKPVESMIHQLEEVATEMIFTSFDFNRAAKAEDLFQVCSHPKKVVEEDWEIAIKQLLPRLNEDSVLLITGSLYFISEIRTYLL
ncbi:bifunctional folylpolyglutamate synthase/dihydrofolate synthase [Sutcliffiella rhizosphaerae]|uniref:tetrahydrofolate synthase n=1 Tax=Sutcliffiella rhizosphaerae TaxID=2880967 RepID=A0ABM8YIF6_9BACI|nr:folylpolyglutamate synthase/dihydrofolate synthase family protein [Sutcliffiella rhizosphaerae]CAG9619515.1 Folylpolyglutamate synthase [Sutcliffiella rhizosphaerae]